MSKPVREVGSYLFDFDGIELPVKFVVSIYHGHTNRACMGGLGSNCGCCWSPYMEVDWATLKHADTGKSIDATADMLAELDAAMNYDPDRYLTTPWVEG